MAAVGSKVWLIDDKGNRIQGTITGSDGTVTSGNNKYNLGSLPSGWTYTNSNAALPTSAGESLVKMVRSEHPLTYGGTNYTWTAQPTSAAPAAVLNEQQRLSQLVSQLQLEQLQGGLNAQGIGESGRADLLTEIAGLRSDLAMPIEPPKRQGGAPRPREEAFQETTTQAPRPTLPGPRPSYRQAEPASPSGVDLDTGVPDMTGLYKALQSADEARSRLRASQPKTGDQVNAMFEQGRFDAWNMQRAVQTYQRDINLTDPHTALLTALNGPQDGPALTLEELGRQAMQSAAVLKRLNLDAQQTDPGIQQLQKQLEVIRTRFNQQSLQGVDPRTGQPIQREISEQERALMIRDYQQIQQSLQNRQAKQARQQKLNAEARQKQLQTLTEQLERFERMKAQQMERAVAAGDMARSRNAAARGMRTRQQIQNRIETHRAVDAQTSNMVERMAERLVAGRVLNEQMARSWASSVRAHANPAHIARAAERLADGWDAKRVLYELSVDTGEIGGV